METDDTSALLKYSPPTDDGGSPIFNYVIEYRLAGSTKWTQANINTKVPELTYRVQKLKKDSEYEFRIAAENRAGVSEFSAPTELTKIEKPIGNYCFKL